MSGKDAAQKAIEEPKPGPLHLSSGAKMEAEAGHARIVEAINWADATGATFEDFLNFERNSEGRTKEAI